MTEDCYIWDFEYKGKYYFAWSCSCGVQAAPFYEKLDAVNDLRTHVPECDILKAKKDVKVAGAKV